MRTQWTTKGNRDAGSSCSCDRGLQRYLWNFGGGLNPPLGTPLFNVCHLSNIVQNMIPGSDADVWRAALVFDVKAKLSLREWRFYLVHGNIYFHYWTSLSRTKKYFKHWVVHCTNGRNEYQIECLIFSQKSATVLPSKSLTCAGNRTCFHRSSIP